MQQIVTGQVFHAGARVLQVVGPVRGRGYAARGASLLAQVYNHENELITPTTITGITYEVFDLSSDTPDAPLLNGSLDPNVAILPNPEPNKGWTLDEIGYNFRHDTPGAFYPQNGRCYAVEYTLKPTVGEEFSVVFERDTVRLRTAENLSPTLPITNGVWTIPAGQDSAVIENSLVAPGVFVVPVVTSNNDAADIQPKVILKSTGSFTLKTMNGAAVPVSVTGTYSVVLITSAEQLGVWQIEAGQSETVVANSLLTPSSVLIPVVTSDSQQDQQPKVVNLMSGQATLKTMRGTPVPVPLFGDYAIINPE